MSNGETLGEASVQYNDLKGTVAIDKNPDSDAVYHLAGLEPGEWFILAYDIYGDSASVWAVSKEAAPTGYDDFVRLGRENNGLIPAQRFEIEVGPGEDAAVALLKTCKRVSIHALNSGLVQEGFDLVQIESD